jgi:hypothetical protein
VTRQVLSNAAKNHHSFGNLHYESHFSVRLRWAVIGALLRSAGVAWREAARQRLSSVWSSCVLLPVSMMSVVVTEIDFNPQNPVGDEQVAAKNADGSYSLHTVSLVVSDDQDKFRDQCPMK